MGYAQAIGLGAPQALTRGDEHAQACGQVHAPGRLPFRVQIVAGAGDRGVELFTVTLGREPRIRTVAYVPR